MTDARGLVARVESATRDLTDARTLRARVLDVLRPVVAFDAFAWLLTDPETHVGADPLAEVPCLSELPTLIRLRYQAPDRWSTLDGVGTPSVASPWLGFVEGYGARDVATVWFGDRFGGWGFLDLWRDREFTVHELALLRAVASSVTMSLRRCQAAAFHVDRATGATGSGPAVLLLSPALEVRRQTEESETLLRRLLPTEVDRRPVPAGAYNVAAQLLAVEAGVDDSPARARVHLGDGQLLSFRAARLGGPDDDIAVTVEPATAPDRMAFFARAHGLTPRESEVLRCVADGDDTRTIARRLGVSDHTAQDHLKSIAARTGLHTRAALLARALGTG